MSVQQGEVVGEVEFWPRPKPRVWLQKLESAAQLVVGLCNKGCIGGMRGGGGKKGGMEGMAVVGWLVFG